MQPQGFGMTSVPLRPAGRVLNKIQARLRMVNGFLDLRLLLPNRCTHWPDLPKLKVEF